MKFTIGKPSSLYTKKHFSDEGIFVNGISVYYLISDNMLRRFCDFNKMNVLYQIVLRPVEVADYEVSIVRVNKIAFASNLLSLAGQMRLLC